MMRMEPDVTNSAMRDTMFLRERWKGRKKDIAHDNGHFANFSLVSIRIMWSLWELNHLDGWTQHTSRVILIIHRAWARNILLVQLCSNHCCLAIRTSEENCQHLYTLLSRKGRGTRTLDRLHSVTKQKKKCAVDSIVVKMVAPTRTTVRILHAKLIDEGH